MRKKLDAPGERRAPVDTADEPVDTAVEAAAEREGDVGTRTGGDVSREEAARDLGEARRRAWAADTACYYAHRRYAQSGSEADRQLWLARNAESDAAVAGLEEAERAVARARGDDREPGKASRLRVVRLRGGGHGLNS